MRRRLIIAAVACAAVGLPLALTAPARAGGPTITVSKTHTGSFVVGSTGTFTIGLAEGSCCGSTGSTQFTVTDSLPTGLTFDATGSGNGTWSCGASGQTVTCTGTPAIATNSSSTFPIVVTVLPAAFPSVTNTATVTDNSCTNCIFYNNNPASDTANVVLATPPAYTKEPGNGTGFPTVLDTFQATGLAQSVSTTDGSRTIILDLPNAAVPTGTQVTLYGGAPSALQSDLPSGATYIDGYAVGWDLLGRTFAATSAITMTVKDPAVTATTVVYSTTGSALASTQATVTAGQYVVTFTADPGFVAAKPAAATPTPTPSVPSTGSGAALGLLWAALVIVGLGTTATLRRRRRPA